MPYGHFSKITIQKGTHLYASCTKTTKKDLLCQENEQMNLQNKFLFLWRFAVFVSSNTYSVYGV